MHIHCPNCHHGIEVVQDVPLETFTCPSCGSKLSTGDAETVTYSPEKVAMMGHFELLDPVGRGHFGTVWRAHDTELERVVAVKIPRTADLSEDERQFFLREARAAARLRHPNIVAVHEVGYDGDQIFIVSDFISGITLAEQLKIRQPSFSEAALWCAAVADAVDYAHDQGVIHRDIKPGNVMLEGESKLYVLDFGLAKMDGGEFTITNEGDILGTPAYMSPEQARGSSGLADRRSDVYSVGVMLYEMLTGQRPFKGDTRSLMHQILYEEPKAPRSLRRNVPRDLETICMKAMAKEPGRRYATARELATDLRHYLAGEPINARRAGWTERAWRYARRNPALTLASGIAAVAVLVSSLFASQLLAGSQRQLVQFKVLQRSTVEPSQQTHPEAKQSTVAFWRLHPDTGEILTDSVMRASGAGNISARLLPGDYLVVVDVPGHGFHEVYRHVAAAGELPLTGYNHQFFKFEKDGAQTLAEIEVPPAAASNDMALVPAGKAVLGPDGTPHSRTREMQLPPFWMDTHEVSIADYVKHRQTTPTAIKNNPEPTDRAVHHVNWLQAMAYAESLGKRLPEEEEYEAVATNYGRQKYPWNGNALLIADWPLGPVGDPEEDRAVAAPAIAGLFSNVAEWTRTWAHLSAGSPIANPAVHTERVVRGAPASVINGTGDPIDLAIDPRHRMFHAFSDEKPGLGFRCVRSIAPRLNKQDFGSFTD